ncbi:hypothetical protein HXX76_007584 [Chlamydomonas incerta]|uniref:Uncharacterized protein n=1 Tax=Chlamydomonas incerta TaxID=51695 RepID=A0A835SWW3_CHLIN|nr:hypothetical protein HXX76_007584 [Chlamydomonas incerta]|eukprot:KAG2434694.1 hypothetical protein HXX76_007584 [Chlamydomonas incerta]
MAEKTSGTSMQELVRQGRADAAAASRALERAAHCLEDTRAVAAQTEAALRATDPQLAAAQRAANQQLDRLAGELKAAAEGRC